MIVLRGGHEGPEGGMGGQSTAALRSIPANCIAMCIVLREREGRLEVGKRGGHRTAPLLMRRPLTGLCRQQLWADEFTS